jgi:signal peptide peptidase SppA
MRITLLNKLTGETVFVTDSCLSVLLSRLFDEADKTAMAEHPRLAQLREDLKPKMEIRNGIAHIPVEGILAYNPDPYDMAYGGVEDSRNILGMVQSAHTNRDVKGIQLNIDSPGGFMTGGPEIADAVASANRTKPVMAHIGGTGASLAYWIASQAGEVMANRAAQVGSIGGYRVNIDRERMAKNMGIEVQVFRNKEAIYKAPGIPGTRLTDAQSSHIVGRVQANADEFRDAVKGARPDVPDSAMNGQVFTGREALAQKLVDSVGDCADCTMKLQKKIKG